MKKTRLFIFMLLIITQTSIVRADFTRTSDGIVKDSITKLEWQDSYPDTDNGTMKASDWYDAIHYCNALDLDGGGWRLPNINELKTLIVDTQFPPAISPVFTVDNPTDNGYLFSSTTRRRYNTINVYSLYVPDGSVYSYTHKDYNESVRCVRNGS